MCDMQEENGHVFAKVQLLDDCGQCPTSGKPQVRLHEDNEVKVVLLRDVGALAVIGIHPDASQAALSRYLVLPWPRRAASSSDPE
jgi:hypothetical protein